MTKKRIQILKVSKTVISFGKKGLDKKVKWGG